jgi:hypothetical protein
MSILKLKKEITLNKYENQALLSEIKIFFQKLIIFQFQNIRLTKIQIEETVPVLIYSKSP